MYNQPLVHAYSRNMFLLIEKYPKSCANYCKKLVSFFYFLTESACN